MTKPRTVEVNVAKYHLQFFTQRIDRRVTDIDTYYPVVLRRRLLWGVTIRFAATFLLNHILKINEKNS